MRVGKVYRESEALIEHVWLADSILTRARGLLGRPPLEISQGLIIKPCSSIHTFGMRYALDIVFVDSTNTVVKLCPRITRNRVAAALNASWTLELRAGEIERLKLSVGDHLQWRDV